MMQVDQTLRRERLKSKQHLRVHPMLDLVIHVHNAQLPLNKALQHKQCALLHSSSFTLLHLARISLTQHCQDSGRCFGLCIHDVRTLMREDYVIVMGMGTYDEGMDQCHWVLDLGYGGHELGQV